MQLKSLVVFTERCQQDMRLKWGGVAVRVIPLYLLSSASFILSFIFKLCHKACISVWSKATCLLSWHRNGSICCSVCFSGKIVEMWLNTSSKFGLCLENFPEEKCILIYRTLNCVEAHNENVQSYFQVSLEAYMDRRIGYIFVRVNVKQSGKKCIWKYAMENEFRCNYSRFFSPCFPSLFLLSLLKTSCHSACTCLQTCQTQWAAQANRIWQNPPNCWAQDVVLWPSARSTWTSSDFYLAVPLRFVWHSNYEC